MSDSHRAPADAVPARAAELIADFMTRQEAWRKQATDLARHRDEVRVAAEREAAALLAKARADIKRTLVDTRRELMMLVTQLRAVGEPLPAETLGRESIGSEPVPDIDWAAVPESIAQLRRDLDKVVAESQPDLEELAGLTRTLSNGVRSRDDKASDVRPEALDSTPQPPSVVAKDPFPYKGPDALARVEYSAPVHRPAVTYDERPASGDYSGHVRKVVIVLAVLAATAVPIAAWRLAGSSDASAHRSTPPPAVAPAVKTAAKSNASAAPSAAAPASAPRPERSLVPASTSSDRQTWLWLVVEARRSAWIQATTDGRTDQGRVLQAGERRRILANQSIAIVVGDAGAVTVSLNGGQATTMGRDGQVVTRRFTTEDAEKIIASRARGGTPGAVPTGGAPAARGRIGLPAEDARAEILGFSQRWLDGYYRSDNNTMAYVAAPDVNVVDERQINERLTFGLTQVNRTFDQVHFEQNGDSALLTARMTEQGDIRGSLTQVISLVSERWWRQADRWRLAGVRLVAKNR